MQDCTGIAAACRWLREAEPGARCCYHRGNLMRDRQRGARSDMPLERSAAIDVLAGLFHEAHLAGGVTLHLKRIAGDCCAYIAIRKGESNVRTG